MQLNKQPIAQTLTALALSAVLLFNVPACKKGGDSNPSPAPAPTPTPPSTTVKTFTNPLLPSGADPFVVRRENTYYYLHTSGNRIEIRKTNTISRLSDATFTVAYTPPASGERSRDLWAPEMFFLNGKWYIYYTAGSGAQAANDQFTSQRCFVLENGNADPTTGTWTDKGRIYDAANDWWAIDGTVMEYNNNLYFLWSGRAGAPNDKQNIYIAPMSNPWTISGPRVLLTTPTLSWETVGSPDVNEGPEILKNPAGRVFMVYSASGCWTDDYGLGMLTLRDNGNPLVATDWTKSTTPVFQKSTSNNVYGPGHNSFFTSRDGTENWIIYHANTAPMNGQGCGDSRSPRMQKFTFNSDGTPNFGNPVANNTPINAPSGE